MDGVLVVLYHAVSTPIFSHDAMLLQLQLLGRRKANQHSKRCTWSGLYHLDPLAAVSMSMLLQDAISGLPLAIPILRISGSPPRVHTAHPSSTPRYCFRIPANGLSKTLSSQPRQPGLGEERPHGLVQELQAAIAYAVGAQIVQVH